jgi:threonyl-tRNA synthetase
MEQVLVTFCTIEKDDERDPLQVAANGAEAVKEVAEQIKTKNIMLYPYAHLSSSLASRDPAIRVVATMESLLKEAGLVVHRSPFGYYKSFRIHCLGHPLAELSRTITAEKKPEERAALQTEYMIMDLKGGLYRPSEYEYSEGEEEFRTLVEKEALKKGLAGGAEPRLIDYCRKFGIEWEPYSDVGHMRYGPEATLLFDLVADYSWNVANRVGIPVLQVRGTNMFDLSVRAVKEHADLFGARLYKIDLDEKSFVMRYAACHQQFAMVKDWTISYRNVPFGTFEVADSYRLEQSGELLLCFRVRKLHMPDLHIYCRELENSKDVSIKTHKVIYDEIAKLGRDYVSVYNTTRSFFEGNKPYFMELARLERKPILLNFVPEGIYYWVLNIEYHIIDELDRPREIATFQIDMGNAKRFDISYVDQNGAKQYPPIIHTALIGTVERYIFTILDRCAKMEQQGNKPQLPLWLAPSQVRIIPVTKAFLSHADELAGMLNQGRVRADVDDSDETVEKRVRDAEMLWIPYIIVVGSREKGAEELPVRVRDTGDQRKMTAKHLVAEIGEKTKGYPFRPLTVPLHVSTRPSYRAYR